jgi:hypothetical protein
MSHDRYRTRWINGRRYPCKKEVIYYAYVQRHDKVLNLSRVIQSHVSLSVSLYSKYSFWVSLTVDTLIRRWTSSSNQRWTARHYLLTRLAHSIRLITLISIWWLDESFQLTIHSRIDDHLIDHIISRFYLMTFHDYVTNRVFNMWAKYSTCEEIENHLYKTLCNHLIKIIHHLIQAST